MANMAGIQETATIQKLSLEEERVVTKVWRRIIWISTLMLLFSQIDKHNIAFAAITMRADLRLSAAAYGMCISIFYIGYVIFEVPSNVIMARVGARVWLSRISITIGLISAATMFAVGAKSLVGLRFLLGIAEAGMVPGMLLYFTYWFPQAYRARANGWFLAAMPVAGIVTSLLSGLIFEMSGLLGLTGWQWLFLILGLPGVILGVFAFFHLTDKPETSSWLNSEEKQLMVNLMQKANLAPIKSSVKISWITKLKNFFTLDVFSLAIANVGVFIALSVNSNWIPQIVRGLFPGQKFAYIGFIAAAPAIITAIFMPMLSAHSDKTAERKWHLVLSLLLSISGLLIAMLSAHPWVGLVGLILCSAGVYGGYGVFWSLASGVLPENHRPAGIAVIHAAGTVGSIFSPLVIGYLRDVTGNFKIAYAFAITMLLISTVMVLIVTRRNKAQKVVVI